MGRSLKAKKLPDGRKKNDPILTGAGLATRFKPGHIPRNCSLRAMLEKYGLSREVINEKFSHLLSATSAELNEVKMDDKTTMLELIIISVIEAAARNADTSRLDNLLDKIFGKQPVETRNVNTNYNVDAEMSEVADDELMLRAVERKERYSKEKK